MKKLSILLIITLLVFLTGCKNDSTLTITDSPKGELMSSLEETQKIEKTAETSTGKSDIDRSVLTEKEKQKIRKPDYTPEPLADYNTGEIIDWFLASGLTTTDFPEYGVSVTYPARCEIKQFPFDNENKYRFLKCDYEFIPDNIIGFNTLTLLEDKDMQPLKENLINKTDFEYLQLKYSFNYFNNTPFFTFYHETEGEPGGMRGYYTIINNQVTKIIINWGYIVGNYSNIADEIFTLISLEAIKKAE